jgi:glycosyltransferase involved in cell wall biosynthesis
VSARTRTLAFVVNHAAFYVSHRLPIGIAALSRGWNVVLISGQAGSKTMEAEAVSVLARWSISHVRTRFGAATLGPITELVGFLQVLIAIRQLRPRTVHTASPKGAIYGGIAARIVGVPQLVIALSGRGTIFTGNGKRLQLSRKMFALLFRWILRYRGTWVIVQNLEDWKWLIDSRMLPADRIRLIKGSGVDLALYSQLTPAPNSNIVVVPARLVREKGIYEFVEAARLLKEKGYAWRFVLVGAADYRHPGAVPVAQIKDWVAQGVIEWWGYKSDMLSVYKVAGVVCLPSYGEGMPKALVEAAAASLPVVTTDVIGCRDAVVSGQTGIIVRPKDAMSLAEGLERLMVDVDRRKSYGAAGRKLATECFGMDAVLSAIFDLYDKAPA